MTCPPLRLVRQLDGPVKTRGSDCGPATVAMQVAFASCSATGPTTTDVRKRMKVRTGATRLPEHEVALNSYGIVGSRKQDAPWDRALEALAHDDVIVSFGIDYAVVNRDAPNLSGAPTFHGFHFVAARLLRADGMVKVFDPLADGRRKGIPTGPDYWPIALLKQAAAGYSGQPDTWSGIIVRRPGPILPPPVPKPCEDQLAEALERIAELESTIDARPGRPPVTVKPGAGK